MGDAFLQNRVGLETEGAGEAFGFRELMNVRCGKGGIR
jgi:hypothetical protein